jgi:hypothetical protein
MSKSYTFTNVFLHFPFSAKPSNSLPAKPEILSRCSEYLAATKANSNLFSINFHHFSTCNYWRNKGLQLFVKLFPNSGTTVAFSTTI